MKELDIGKKDFTSELVKKAPRPLIFDNYLKNRLNKLKNRPEPKDDDNNNNNFSPPPSPPLLPPPPPPPEPQAPSGQPPPPPPFFHHHQENFCNHYLKINHPFDRVILFPFYQHCQHFHLRLMIIIFWGVHHKEYQMIYMVLRHKH